VDLEQGEAHARVAAHAVEEINAQTLPTSACVYVCAHVCVCVCVCACVCVYLCAYVCV